MSNLHENALVGSVLVAVGLAAAALIVGILALTGDDGEGDALARANAPAYTVWPVGEAVAHYETEGLTAEAKSAQVQFAADMPQSPHLRTCNQQTVPVRPS